MSYEFFKYFFSGLEEQKKNFKRVFLSCFQKMFLLILKVFFRVVKNNLELRKHIVSVEIYNMYISKKKFEKNFNRYRVIAPDKKWVFLRKSHLKLKIILLTIKINSIKLFKLIFNSFFMVSV